MVLGLNWEKGVKTHRQTLLDKLNWPNVTQILQSATMNMVKRAISGNASKAINEMFKIKRQRHPRGEPYATLQHTGPVNRNETNFSARATLNFNRLPIKLRNPEITCSKFKADLKSHIRNNHKLTQHINVGAQKRICERTPNGKTVKKNDKKKK